MWNHVEGAYKLMLDRGEMSGVLMHALVKVHVVSHILSKELLPLIIEQPLAEGCQSVGNLSTMDA